MAIIIEQSSECPVCGETLSGSKEYILVPPLTNNLKDDLFVFSDNGAHIDCMNSHPFKEKLFANIEMYHKNLPPANLRCVVDNGLIPPGKLLYFGMLTSGDKEELHAFNYIALNKENIKNWGPRNEFIDIAQRFLSEGKWIGFNGFNYLEHLINELRPA